MSLHYKVFNPSGHVARVLDNFYGKNKNRKQTICVSWHVMGKKYLINHQECITKTATYVLHYLQVHCK